MSFSQVLLATAFVAVAVLLSIALARVLRRDGYGDRCGPRSHSDWGTTSTPSHPYSSQF